MSNLTRNRFPVKPYRVTPRPDRPFGEGILDAPRRDSRERPKPYTAADLAWWAEVSNEHATDFEVVVPEPEPDWDAMAAEAWAVDCLCRGLDPHDRDVIAEAISRAEADAYDRIP